MFEKMEKAVLGMSFLRLLSGSIEISAALLMFKLNNLDKAIIVNSSLALIGPLILAATTTIGLFGMVGTVSLKKIFIVFFGVALILFAMRGN